jgi:hypothetical protein
MGEALLATVLPGKAIEIWEASDGGVRMWPIPR